MFQNLFKRSNMFILRFILDIYSYRWWAPWANQRDTSANVYLLHNRTILHK